MLILRVSVQYDYNKSGVIQQLLHDQTQNFQLKQSLTQNLLKLLQKFNQTKNLPLKRSLTQN